MPLRTSDIGSGLVSHAMQSSKLSNDKAFDSLFYESYDETSNQSAKAIRMAKNITPADSSEDVTIDQL